MYICVCKAVTDKDIHKAINQGCCSRRMLKQTLGAGSVCGQCTPMIREMLDQAQPTPPIIMSPALA